MPVKASDLIARGKAAQERMGIDRKGQRIATAADRCAHGVPFHPPQPCRECDRVWHTQALANAEASVAKHKAALAALDSP